jgi:hypothetical protein
MKNIYRLNLVVVGIPIVLGLLGTVFNILFFYALISTMLTGFVQVIIGLKMLIDEPKDRKLKVYIGSVILFFLLWYLIANTSFDTEEIYYFLFLIPIFLASFLSYIIYKKIKL